MDFHILFLVVFWCLVNVCKVEDESIEVSCSLVVFNTPQQAGEGVGIGPLLTLVSVSLAEHVPELRFSIPVRHGQLVWLRHAPAAIGTPAPGGSEPGNAPPSFVPCSRTGMLFL